MKPRWHSFWYILCGGPAHDFFLFNRIGLCLGIYLIPTCTTLYLPFTTTHFGCRNILPCAGIRMFQTSESTILGFCGHHSSVMSKIQGICHTCPQSQEGYMPKSWNGVRNGCIKQKRGWLVRILGDLPIEFLKVGDIWSYSELRMGGHRSKICLLLIQCEFNPHVFCFLFCVNKIDCNLSTV